MALEIREETRNISTCTHSWISLVMGNDTSKAIGTDFKENRRQKRRATDDGTDDDIPIIPYVKHKKITEDVQRVMSSSIWMCNFKRAFRGYLRRKPERSQIGTQMRIQEQALQCADELGLPKDSFEALIDTMVDEVGLVWYEDALDFLKEKGKIRDGCDISKERNCVNDAIATVFRQMAYDYAVTIGKKIYEKYSRGADFEASDIEMDEEKRKKIAQERAEAIRRAAEERERQALEWKKEAEMEAMIHEARQRDLEKMREHQKKVNEHSLL